MAAICRGLSRLPSKFNIARAFSVSSAKLVGDGSRTDTPTHTGQVWAKDDYRRVRFVDKDKHINPQYAIDLIAEDPVVVCTERVVPSNSGGALGHPKVYVNVDKPEVAVCGYSGRKFIHKKYYDAAKHGPSITYQEYLEELKTMNE